MKKTLTYILITTMILTMTTGCGSKKSSTNIPASSSPAKEATQQEPAQQEETDTDANVENTDNTVNAVDTTETTDTDKVASVDTEAAQYINLEALTELSTALDMMVVYEMSYDNPTGDPGEQFWNKFVAATIQNSWFAPFYEEGADTLWDNARIAEAASKLTGQPLECNAFSEKIDASDSASPYLNECYKENISVDGTSAGIFDIQYDMSWACCSLVTENGLIKVNAVVKANPESPLDGYSIQSLKYEVVKEPVHEVEE